MSDTQDDLTALIAELKDAQASDVTLDLTIGNNGTLQRAIEALERAHFQRRAEPVACMWPTNLEGISAFAFTELAIEEGMKQPGARLLYTSPPIPADMVMVPRWEQQAVAWLRGKAAEQAQNNERWPEHAKCYPSWVDRVKYAQLLADDLEREAGRSE